MIEGGRELTHVSGRMMPCDLGENGIHEWKVILVVDGRQTAMSNYSVNFLLPSILGIRMEDHEANEGHQQSR